MLDAGKFWTGYSLIIAQGVFLGTLLAMVVQGMGRLAWLGIKELWKRYGHRIY